MQNDEPELLEYEFSGQILQNDEPKVDDCILDARAGRHGTVHLHRERREDGLVHPTRQTDASDANVERARVARRRA